MIQQKINNSTRKYSLSLKKRNLQIGNKIGHGTYGTVYEAFKITTGQKIAVKILSFDNDNYQSVKSQANICQKIHHKNIVRIQQVIEIQNKIYICMEYCQNGQLFNYIKKYGPLNQKLAGKIFIQLHSAVKYLHLRKIAHRDIKSQNVLLDASMNPKLIDFGLSKQYTTSNPLLETVCGSPSYVAPQIVKKQKYSGQKVDVWSLGVTLYIMLEAAQPFFSKSNSETKHKIANLDWSVSHHSSVQAQQLYQLIFVEASKRISLSDMQKSSFFEKYLRQYTKRGRFESKSTQKTERLSTGELLQLKNPQIIAAYKQKQKMTSLKNILEIDIKKLRKNLLYNSIGRGQPFLQFNTNTNINTNRKEKNGRSIELKDLQLDFRINKNNGKYQKVLGQTQNHAWYKRQVISDLNHY